MRKKPVLTFASTVLIASGIAIVGLSVTHIRAMDAISGSQVLPEIAFRHSAPGTHASMARAVPVRGDYIGTISIPALKKTLPIYQGTENSQLEKGVGHYEGSVLPGQKDNSVLAGHRDGVFAQFGKLKLGDLVLINTADGKFIYKISRFRIVGENDRTVIVPTKTAVLTLSTCYPFFYIGNAPKRYIVSADLIGAPQSIGSQNS
ncbi:MAG TPA: class D sortase [Candidatus Nanopelagicaceae bacterium]